MYNVFKICFIVYFVLSVIVSGIAFYFVDEHSSKKVKNAIVINSIVVLGMLFALMELKP